MKKQKVQAKINLEALAGGAFAEKLNEALMQVAENIQNPNWKFRSLRATSCSESARDAAEPLPSSWWLLTVVSGSLRRWTM